MDFFLENYGLHIFFITFAICNDQILSALVWPKLFMFQQGSFRDSLFCLMCTLILIVLGDMITYLIWTYLQPHWFIKFQSVFVDYIQRKGTETESNIMYGRSHENENHWLYSATGFNSYGSINSSPYYKKRYHTDATRRAEIFAELMAKPLTRNSP